MRGAVAVAFALSAAACALGVAHAVAQMPPPSPSSPAPKAPEEPRPAPAGPSPELLRLDCASTLGRRETTLFDRGAVRLREGPAGEEQIGVRELGPDELDGALRRLEAIDLGEVRRLPRGVEGEWVERCTLDVALPGRASHHFEFGRYDPLPLPLGQVLIVVDGLVAGLSARPPAELPQGYRARRGDLLRRIDGAVYRVVGATADGRGIELRGIDQPLTIYVPRDALRQEFIELLPAYTGPLGPK